VALALGTATFVLHPTRVESVSWIAGSTDLWMTLFALAALLCASSARRTVRLVLVPLFGTAAFFSKETAVVLPVLIASDALLLCERGPSRRQRLQAAGGSMLAMGAALALRARIVAMPDGALLAGGPLASAERVAASAWSYFNSSVLPLSPSVHSARPLFAPDGSPQLERSAVILGGVLIGAVLALCAFALRRRALHAWLADGAYVVLPLLPVLNLLDLRLDVLVAERFLYFPFVGVAALAARALLASQRLGELPARILGLAFGLMLCMWAAVTWTHQAHFHSDEALWTYEATRDPGDADALMRLGQLALQREAPAEAIVLFAQCHRVARVHHDLEHAVECALRAAEQHMLLLGETANRPMRELAAFFDALFDHERAAPVAVLRYRGLELEVKLDASTRALLRDEFSVYELGRAETHVRIGELEQAEAVLRGVIGRAPRALRPRVELARLLARRGRFGVALETVARARDVGLPGVFADRLTQEIRGLERDASRRPQR
jgi:hypothetical protein